MLFTFVDQTGSDGSQTTAIILGALTLLSSLGVAWFAFKSKKVNPLENGAAFIATEARALAEFHREDAEATRLRVRALEIELNDTRLQLNQATKDKPT